LRRRRLDDPITYSPSDLCRFMESRFASWMDRLTLDDRDAATRDEPDESEELVRRRGREHEQAVLRELVDSGADVADVGDAGDRRAATLEAMRAGRAFVWQPLLTRAPFAGYPDLLVRVEGASGLGDFHYVPREIKLAFSARPKHVVQLCAYADMLEAMQGLRPERLEVVLGNRERVELRTLDYVHYYARLRDEFLAFMADFDPAREPVPEARADHSPWSSHAEARLEALDHLSRVANIRTTQIRRLEAAGITTMRALAESALERVPRLETSIFERLRDQARLQVESAGLDRPLHQVVRPDPERPDGLALLPPPSPGDVFFDIEGFPLVEGGLEYLLGATFVEGGERRFADWWAHDRAEEKAAFEGFVDWVYERWRADPAMHVYHYASYEVTALTRLMGRHGTREAEVDHLLRRGVFVDLYAIVRRGLRIGEPSYSLKNVERLYREAREGEVETAGESIVQYQRWLDSGEPRDWRRSPILEGIRAYNRDDCDSTLMLAEWLRERQRDHGIEYAGDDEPEEPGDPERELGEATRRRSALARRMLAGDDEPPRHLLGHLVEFHRREDKPTWWETFARHDMTDDELFEDLACLGKLERTEDPEERRGRSLVLRYRFDPDQDTKLDEGDGCYLAHVPLLEAEIVELDRDAGRVAVRFGPKLLGALEGALPTRLSLIPNTRVPAETIAASLERIAEGTMEGRPPTPATCAACPPTWKATRAERWQGPGSRTPTPRCGSSTGSATPCFRSRVRPEAARPTPARG
jgi:uncharacterized protein